ncbi:MAG: ABC transporter permease [Chloroflexi bacterium]|nr:ABC transporter permease [Chloroflexota bacterium]
MDDLRIAWRDLWARPVPTLVAMAVVGLAVALFVSVTHLGEALQRGIVRASDPFGVLVVGAKGDSRQLVLSTLLLQGLPVGNIPEEVHDRLADDPRVDLAVPLAFGDNVGGARIVGTDDSFLDLAPGPDAPASFHVAEGRWFTGDQEAVLGSRAARDTGLAIGDTFRPAHGVEAGLEDDEHDLLHTVVGILEPSSTAFDGAVMTSLHSVIEAHEEEAHEEEAHEEEASGEGATEHEDHAITALLVRPVGFAEANSLWQEAYAGAEYQAAFPGQELGGLFDLLDQARDLLVAVGWLAAVMAGLTVFLAAYAAGATRDRLLAIMRALGATRGTVFRLVLLETVVIAVVGALLGRVIGVAAATVIGDRITSDQAIPVDVTYQWGLEPWLWVLSVGLGIAAGALPAWSAYRASVVARLSGTWG